MTTTLRGHLDAPYAEIKDAVRQQLDDPGFARPAAGLTLDEFRDSVLDRTREVAKTGLSILSFPREYGGTNDPGGRVASFETLAFGDLSLLVKVGVQFGLFAGAIHRLGTTKHHDKYLAAVGALEIPGCFAMSESGHGSDVANLRTRATYDAEAGEFVVHTPDERARKDWIGNAARHGRLAVVFAQLHTDEEDRGVHAFLVPIRDSSGNVLPGVEIGDCGPKMGLNGVDNGRMTFNAVRIPRDNLLDRFATVAPDGTYASPIKSNGARFFTMIGALVEGRICIAAAGLSVAKSALTIGVRYGEQRRQFGVAGEEEFPLMDYLTHQLRLIPAIARVYALDAAHKHLVRLYATQMLAEEPDPIAQRTLEALTAGIKATTTWNATATVQAARETCGGKGYLSVNGFAALKGDSDVMTTFEGDNTVLMQLLAKALLGEAAAQFEDRDARSLLKLLRERATGRLAEVPLIAARTVGSVDKLRGREAQLDLFRAREKRLVISLGQRLARRIEDGEAPQVALNSCQDHALAAARAHIETVTLEQFSALADSSGAPELLAPLCELYFASQLVADRGWFLEHELISAAQSKAAVARVNELCGELRPSALELVEAFGIPDAALPPLVTEPENNDDEEPV